ncbi:YfbM family protein [Mitsuaria sp. GD03876]|uniref:YfbM family protein n=1 Tax=Mitsuaria sp. GD03876 TaxID=2975399 RepID=UPI00244B33DB|nr:YfbM family protein [Mitsuaria sp. GD03876]MDH0863483.1 YfbM family protein [Mitsuaria sp. GD03876]
MGLYASFRAIDDATANELLDDPDAIERLLGEEDEAEDLDRLGIVDIDKAWHGLHFLLLSIAEAAGAGEDAPLARAVLGGEPLSEEEDCRVLGPEEVRDIAAALAAITEDQLRDAFDPAAMAEADIYPDIWVRDGEEALDYLLVHFPTLVRFYRTTADAGHGALLRIC